MENSSFTTELVQEVRRNRLTGITCPVDIEIGSIEQLMVPSEPSQESAIIEIYEERERARQL